MVNNYKFIAIASLFSCSLSHAMELATTVKKNNEKKLYLVKTNQGFSISSKAPKHSLSTDEMCKNIEKTINRGLAKIYEDIENDTLIRILKPIEVKEKTINPELRNEDYKNLLLDRINNELKNKKKLVKKAIDKDVSLMTEYFNGFFKQTKNFSTKNKKIQKIF